MRGRGRLGEQKQRRPDVSFQIFVEFVPADLRDSGQAWVLELGPEEAVEGKGAPPGQGDSGGGLPGHTTCRNSLQR